MVKSVKNYLSLVTFAHTVFAMPFAFIGFFTQINALSNIQAVVGAFNFGIVMYDFRTQCSNGI